MNVDMPEVNGYEAAGMMKKNEAHKGIPIIFISGRIDPTSEIFGMNMGALDYIHKPFVSEILIRRIKTYLSLVDYQKILEEKSKSLKDISGPLENMAALSESLKDSDNVTALKEGMAKIKEVSRELLASINKAE